MSDDEFQAHVLEMQQRLFGESDEEIRSVLEGYRIDSPEEVAFSVEIPTPAKVNQETALVILTRFPPRYDLCSGARTAEKRISSLERENRQLRRDMADAAVRYNVLHQTVAKLTESVRSLQKVDDEIRAA
jgi:hypothetical protein